MIPSALLLTVALAQVPIWARVVDDFGECREFFYKGAEPQGLDRNAAKICQQYGNDGSFYASLYSTSHRIPLYSAYKFDPTCRNKDGWESGDWLIEPQLLSPAINSSSMQPEKSYDREALKSKQAINEDYSNTGYDRGRLNPNSFQCGDGCKATLTLTNSAPMDPSYHALWREGEDSVRDILRAQPDNEGTAYLVTGTVPSPDHRVAGQNHPEGEITFMSLPQRNSLLANLYAASTVQIFKDDCSSTTSKSEEILNKLLLSDRLVTSEDVLKKLPSAMSQSADQGKLPSNRSSIREPTSCGEGKGVGSYNGGGLDCMDSMCSSFGKKYYWCYTTSEGSWDYCCQTKSPFSALHGRTCKSGNPCNYYGSKYLWCYTTDGTWDYCCTQ
ncbi:hypothetical protein ACEWY4_004829 [Coilia grayii]|uniref:Uncharacterized protein n=1 Tax=Coilia grayii TaxID=363190 RepID=A0ABD1KMP3_9TELE